MSVSLKAFLILTAVSPLFAVAGVDFEKACAAQNGYFKQSNRVESINAVAISSGFKKTVKVEGYHYSIHDNNQYVFDLAKAAYLTRARVKSCIRKNNTGLDELVGIELSTEKSPY